MDEPASGLRDSAERVALAALGAVALTAERAEQLAESIAARGPIGPEEARRLARESTERWRGEALRLGERAGVGLEGLFRELGLVPRADHDELDLRIAQLEHRIRLLEAGGAPAAAADEQDPVRLTPPEPL